MAGILHSQLIYPPRGTGFVAGILHSQLIYPSNSDQWLPKGLTISISVGTWWIPLHFKVNSRNPKAFPKWINQICGPIGQSIFYPRRGTGVLFIWAIVGLLEQTTRYSIHKTELKHSIRMLCSNHGTQTFDSLCMFKVASSLVEPNGWTTLVCSNDDSNEKSPKETPKTTKQQC